MNEPIISPWIIYALSVSDGIKGISILVAMVTFIITVMSVISLPDLRPEDYEKDRKYLKIFKAIWVTLVISAAFSVLIPDKNTIYQMVIAQHVTPANIQMVGEGAEKAVDKVIEKILNYQIKLEKK